MITATNYFEEIASVEVNNLPQTLRDLHEYVVRVTENGATWDTYHNSEKIRKVIDLYFGKLSEFVSANEKKTKSRSNTRPVRHSESKRQSAARKTKASTKVPFQKNDGDIIPADKVEHIREEVKFIKRFVGLHNKVKSPSAILAFIKALQRSIVQKCNSCLYKSTAAINCPKAYSKDFSAG
jgi:hypothetical protein